jgi:tetratricopeptide (TPR) repeat protein
MRKSQGLKWLSIIFFLSGCTTFRTAGQVQSGRVALLSNNPEQALIHFQEAAQSDPNYIYAYGPFLEGVWTYVGRAQYNTGKLPEARQSLERALSVYPDDNLARLYLGLTLARGEDRSQGLKVIEGGMKGIYDWLEHINYYSLYGQFWDPARAIRSEIEKSLGMISGKDIDWPKLISSAEWVGQKMEEEIDKARDDERRYRDRQFDRRLPGTGIGIGVGGGF